MDFDGKTLVRIYRDKWGRIAYNTFFGSQDDPPSFEILGALEFVKFDILKKFPDAEGLPEEEAKKTLRLLDENKTPPTPPDGQKRPRKPPPPPKPRSGPIRFGKTT